MRIWGVVIDCDMGDVLCGWGVRVVVKVWRIGEVFVVCVLCVCWGALHCAL